jgi:hypothetical protein
MIENYRIKQAGDITAKFLDNKAFGLFHYPVDLIAFPMYKDYVRKPMDLTTVSKKHERGEYKSFDEWYDDMNLIFSNSLKFNEGSALITAYTTECRELFKKEVKKVDQPSRKLKEYMNIQLTKMTKLISHLTQKAPSVFPKDDRYTSDQLLPFTDDDTTKLIEKINNMNNPEDVLKVTQIMEFFGVEKIAYDGDEARYHSDNLTEDAKIYIRAAFPK